MPKFFHASGQTGMTKLIIDFLNFVTAPENDSLIDWLEVILEIVEALSLEKYYGSQNEI